MISRKDFWDLLLFLGRIDDTTKTGAEKAEWKAGLRRELGSRDDKTLDALSAHMQHRYDEIEATRGSVYTRANSLLLFVGVMTTGAGLIGQSLTGAPTLLVAAFVIDGLLLLISIVATAILAVRAHLVSNWDVPWIKPGEATDERAVKVIYATEILVAVEQNKIRIRTPVAFLANAQKYAFAAIAFLAMLAVLSVTAAILKPPTVADDDAEAASPVPAASVAPPSPSPSPSPSPTVAITPIARSPSAVPPASP